MTETQWLASCDPASMLGWITTHGRGRRDDDPVATPLVSDRKLRLFACAVERAWWSPWSDPAIGRAMAALDRYGEGGDLDLMAEWPAFTFWPSRASGVEAARECLLRHDRGEDKPKWAVFIRDVVGNPWRPIGPLWSRCPACGDDPQFAASGTCRTCDGKGSFGVPGWLGWNGGTVPRMARAIYEERRWEDLPVLADALEEAGCGDTEILAHCRERRQWQRCAACVETMKLYAVDVALAGVVSLKCNEACPGGTWIDSVHVRGCFVVDCLLGKE
jgi:hypothetical protein